MAAAAAAIAPPMQFQVAASAPQPSLPGSMNASLSPGMTASTTGLAPPTAGGLLYKPATNDAAVDHDKSEEYKSLLNKEFQFPWKLMVSPTDKTNLTPYT